jgi:hypothetical protein
MSLRGRKNSEQPKLPQGRNVAKTSDKEAKQLSDKATRQPSTYFEIDSIPDRLRIFILIFLAIDQPDQPIRIVDSVAVKQKDSVRANWNNKRTRPPGVILRILFIMDSIV